LRVSNSAPAIHGHSDPIVESLTTRAGGGRWNSSSNNCEALTAPMICGNVAKFSPPGSGPLAERCNNIAQGNLCRMLHGQCLPIDCATISDEATCNWENDTAPLPHCAWQPNSQVRSE